MHVKTFNCFIFFFKLPRRREKGLCLLDPCFALHNTRLSTLHMYSLKVDVVIGRGLAMVTKVGA